MQAYIKTLISFSLLIPQDMDYVKKCKMLTNPFDEVIRLQSPSWAFMAEKLSFYLSKEKESYFRTPIFAYQAYKSLIHEQKGQFIHWWFVSPGNLPPCR